MQIDVVTSENIQRDNKEKVMKDEMNVKDKGSPTSTASKVMFARWCLLCLLQYIYIYTYKYIYLVSKLLLYKRKSKSKCLHKEM